MRSLVSVLALSSTTMTFASNESMDMTGRIPADKYCTIEAGNSKDILALPSGGTEIATPEGLNLFRLFSTSSKLTYTHKVRYISNIFVETKATAT